MNTTIKLIYGLLHNADGAAATEYALLLSGIALAALAGMMILGGASWAFLLMLSINYPSKINWEIFVTRLMIDGLTLSLLVPLPI